MRRVLLAFVLVSLACASDPPAGRDGGDMSPGGSGAYGGGGGAGGGPGGSGGGAGGGMGGAGGGMGGACDEEPHGIPAPYGLDSRPPNPTCVAPPRPSSAAAVELRRVFPRLTFEAPLLMIQAPNDASRWYVVEKAGRIRTFANTPDVADAELFADLRDRVESRARETGLLGLAFHPLWPTRSEVFVNYTSSRGGLHTVVSRFQVVGGALDPDSEQIVLEVDQPTDRHNGGHIAFGPDGMLYIGMGDGGQGVNVGRDELLLGKMLRIDVEGTPYSIPPDNPWTAGPLRPEVWATGLRNPWRWSFDRETGALWLGDVGASAREEIDVIEPGKNYGWPIREGAACFGGGRCDTTGLTDPILDYGRSEGQCVTGGYVYRGRAIPALHGTYVFGDFANGRVWALFPNESKPGLLLETALNIASFAEDVDGELYAVDHIAGGLYQLVPTEQARAFPGRLSETGCVNPRNAREPVAGAIPYSVNAALWSDGARKDRWLAIPDGTTITVLPDGDWEFPPGSVLMKDFYLGCRKVETRLLVRHDDGGWAGYSYEWNEEQTDAFLLSDRKTVEVNGRKWTFPSRSDCMQCHTAAAGRALGPETAQLDREIVWPSGRYSNVVDTLEHIGMFSDPVDRSAGPLPDPFGSAHVEARAKAYLHGNCSSCHRPDGTGQGPADFRYATPLAEMAICNEEPQQGDGGLLGGRLLVPGNPALSIIPHRMRALDSRRMPAVGSAIVDEEGTALVEEWIRWLTACP